jgi:hypothetical protein
MHASRVTLLVTAVVGMICTFLPWANVVFFGSVYGTQGDGWITFALCAATVLPAVLGDRRGALPVGPLVFGALFGVGVALIALFEIFHLKSTIADTPFSGAISIGPGLYLLIVAGVAMAIVPALLALNRPATPQPQVAWHQPPPQAWQPPAPPPQQPGTWPPAGR